MKSIIELQHEYIQLLSDELNEVVGMASIHGWQSSRVAEGERLRKEIEAAQPSPTIKDEGEELYRVHKFENLPKNFNPIEKTNKGWYHHHAMGWLEPLNPQPYLT